MGVRHDRSSDAAAQKTAALEVVYRLNVVRLYRLFSRRASPQDAPDLVQETFTRFATASLERDIEPDCDARYLTQVAVNVLRDRNKSAHYRASLRAVPVEDVHFASSGQQEMLEARDQLKRVEAVMLLLKPLTRNIFIARRFRGLSRAEIVEQTGLSLKAVDKHLAKAVRHLYLHLGDRDGR